MSSEVSQNVLIASVLLFTVCTVVEKLTNAWLTRLLARAAEVG